MAESLRASALARGKPSPVCVKVQDSVRNALEIMKAHNFSQLPILDGGNKCVGIITSENIAYKLLEDQELFDKPVNECVAKCLHVEGRADLVDYLDAMAEKGCLLIGSSNYIESIITNYDVLKLFRKIAEPFAMIYEIETNLRNFVQRHIPDRSDREEAISSLLGKMRGDRFAKGSTLDTDDLDFEELRQLIIYNWEKFAIPSDRDYVNDLLESIRGIRNKVCHFRGPLTVEELDKLKDMRKQVMRITKL
jgi:CBS domain-containing protein